MSEQMLDGKTTFARLSPQDRAQAQRQTTLILRHLDVLDAVLVEFLDRPPPLLARNVLRLCVAEMLLESLAPYAAIDGAVSFAKSHPRLGGFSALINAVGRNFARKVEAEALVNPESKEPTDEPNKESKEPKEPAEFPPQTLPKDFRKHLIKTYDEDSVTAFEAAHHRGAPTDITLKDQSRAEEYAEKLGATVLPNGSLRLPPRGQISALTGYDAGDWWVQDAAASIAVRACGDLAGKRVLDMCAAPGGKALQLAAAGADLTALDISKNRMSRVKDNLQRCGLDAQTVVADALEWPGGAPFDVIIVDAPCSATGTMRRHPDLPFVKPPAPEPALVELQRDLLERAAGYLARGGVLVFAACSLYAEEGEAHADWIKAHPELGKTLSVVPLKAKDYGLPKEAGDKLGGLRLRPDFWAELGGMDGFYIVKFVFSG